MPNDILQFAFCAEVRKLVTHHLTPTCMHTKLNSEVRFWLSSQHSEMTVSFKFQLNVIFTRRTADNKTATEKQVHFSYFLKGKKIVYSLIYMPEMQSKHPDWKFHHNKIKIPSREKKKNEQVAFCFLGDKIQPVKTKISISHLLLLKVLQRLWLFTVICNKRLVNPNLFP